jgi:hypothetical protein
MRTDILLEMDGGDAVMEREREREERDGWLGGRIFVFVLFCFVSLSISLLPAAFGVGFLFN